MTTERTLSIIKPDAVARRLIGSVCLRLEQSGLRIIAMRMLHLSRDQAENFYGEHRQRSFFPDLIRYMTSGPVVVQVLEGKDAVATNRQVMGATDPAQAEKGTLRADFGSSIEANVVHGSDSLESARREVGFFFPELEVAGSS